MNRDGNGARYKKSLQMMGATVRLIGGDLDAKFRSFIGPPFVISWLVYHLHLTVNQFSNFKNCLLNPWDFSNKNCSMAPFLNLHAQKKYFHAEVSQQARNWPPRKTPLELWSMFIYPSVSGGPSEHARLDDLSASHFFARTSSGSEQYFIPFCPSSEPFDGNFSSVSRAGNPTYNWFYFQFCIKQKLQVVCKKTGGYF